MSPEALHALTHHTWPGNVRELRNLLDRLAVFTSGSVINEADVSAQLVLERPDRSDPQGVGGVSELAFKTAKRAFEKRYLTRAMARSGGNISRTAIEIGVDRRYLYDLLDKHGLR